MKPGKFYMHNRAMDIYIQVLGVNFDTTDFLSLDVFIWNLGYSGKPYIIEQDQHYTIKPSEVPNYIEITMDQIKIPRTKSGLPV